jgi:hypothetical protein
MASPPIISSTLPSQGPSWLARNWKWLVAVAAVGLLVLLAAFGGLILLVIETSVQHSDFYPMALARARENPEVLEKLGQPIQLGWLTSGSINISGPSGSADVSIPLHGPKAEGTLYVVAKKSAGRSGFETLQVEVKGESQRIDLLSPPHSS